MPVGATVNVFEISMKNCNPNFASRLHALFYDTVFVGIDNDLQVSLPKYLQAVFNGIIFTANTDRIFYKAFTPINAVENITVTCQIDYEIDVDSALVGIIKDDTLRV
jgi:hypothetical protein